MSTEKTNLTSMLEQFEAKNKTSNSSSTAKKYDLKNYFTTHIKDGVQQATKNVRILPTADGSSAFVEVRVHPMVVDGQKKKFACLKHEKGLACPFCEAREVLLATGGEAEKTQAKAYYPRLVYIVKVIDRDAPQEGVKFWRINDDYRKEGVYDKISGLVLALKKDITDPTIGRDLAIMMQRNASGMPVVSSVASMDPSPLSTDAEEAKAWLADTRTWEDVYSVKNYEFLEILVKGGTPVWDKESKKYIDKAGVEAKSDNTEAELTMGVENVKAGIKEATTTTVAEDEGTDDLPF